MLIQFTSSEVVFESFIEAIVWGVAVVFIMAFATFLGLLERGRSWAIRAAVCLNVIGTACVLLVAYFSNYGKFISAEFNSSGAKLICPGQWGKEVFVPGPNIKNVLFGLPGKTEGRCYIRIEQASGENHKSTTVVRKVEDCKSLRGEILKALKT